jgi:hypothetical protein
MLSADFISSEIYPGARFGAYTFTGCCSRNSLDDRQSVLQGKYEKGMSRLFRSAKSERN